MKQVIALAVFVWIGCAYQESITSHIKWMEKHGFSQEEIGRFEDENTPENNDESDRP